MLVLSPTNRSSPRCLETSRNEWRPRSTGDLNRMLGLTHGYEEDFLNLVAKNNSVTITQVTGKIVVSERSNPQLPRMVMLRDSFANFLIGMLSQHFRRAVYVWDNRFDPVLMEQEHPDIVLFELVERRLDETSDQSFFASDIAMPASTGNGQQSAGSRRGR
jgi:hypothetical protein